MDPQQVIHIGKAYTGAKLCLADLVAVGQSDVTIIIEPDMQVTFTDSIVPSGTITFVCQQNSRVVYILESYAQQSNTTAVFAWYVHEKSEVECVIISAIETAPVVIAFDFYLQQENARASCHGLITVADGGACEIKTRQIHTAEHTTSTVRVHTVVGAAIVDYRGVIDIGHAGVHANAVQSNKNILLSALGKIIAIPTLQVRTHKVRCTHGAAVGSLVPEQLTYLQARGISQNTARMLLLQGFLSEALQGASHAAVCHVGNRVENMNHLWNL